MTTYPYISEQTRTAEEVLADFQYRGVSIAEWARAHGFNPALVYIVLKSGKIPMRGQKHNIAVALKMKPGMAASGDTSFTDQPELAG